MPNHRDLNLTRVGHIVADPLGDLERKSLSHIVAHATGVHHNTNFSTRVNGIGISYAAKRLGDLFQIPDSLDIPFNIIPARSRP